MWREDLPKGTRKRVKKGEEPKVNSNVKFDKSEHDWIVEQAAKKHITQSEFIRNGMRAYKAMLEMPESFFR